MSIPLQAPTGVLLWSDPLQAQRLGDVLQQQGRTHCVWFDKPDQALSYLAERQPDFFLTESFLNGLNGYALVRQVKQRCRADCVIRVSETGMYTHDALTTNLSGYLAPDADPEEYLICLEHIQKGRRYVSPGLMDWLRNTASSTVLGKPALRRLSDRERDVLRLLADGLENDAIAHALGLSPTTLPSHFANLKHKLGLSSTRQLLLFAARHFPA